MDFSPVIIAFGALFGIISTVLICLLPIRLCIQKQRQRRQRELQTLNMAGERLEGDPFEGGDTPRPPIPPPAQSADAAAYHKNLETILEPSRTLREKIELVGDPLPRDLMCPVTAEIFVDPVVIADGHTYERIAILQWFKKKYTSPVTNLPVDPSIVVPNTSFREQVLALQEKYLKDRRVPSDVAEEGP